MNIQGITSAAVGAAVYDAVKVRSRPAEASQSVSSQGEKVAFSSVSEEMTKVRNAMENDQGYRLKMVKEIQLRIKNNDYPIENNLDESLKQMLLDRIL